MRVDDSPGGPGPCPHNDEAGKVVHQFDSAKRESQAMVIDGDTCPPFAGNQAHQRVASVGLGCTPNANAQVYQGRQRASGLTSVLAR